jgi:hypothetical protein
MTEIAREQVRTILHSLGSKDLLDIFKKYLTQSQLKVAVRYHKKSEKVIEVTFSTMNKLIKAVGGNKNEALAGAVKVFLEGILQDDTAVSSLKQCIRKSNCGREVGNQKHQSHQTSTEKYSNTHDRKTSIASISQNENILQPNNTSNNHNLPISMDLK